jgi:hypothetical protein
MRITWRHSPRLPVRENIGETEVLVVAEGMQIQKVADVDVLHAEGIRLAVRLLLRARRVVVNLRSGTFERIYYERALA